MKQYIYNPTECGREAWPSGELRLAGIESISDPNSADVFIYPGPLIEAFRYGLDLLPFMRGKEERHVFLDVSDHFEQPIGKPCMFIRCNMRTWMKNQDPNSIPFAWPVEDFGECVELPEAGFIYDVSFHGWLSTDTRRVSSQACLDHGQLKCDMARYNDFCGYIYFEPEGIRRRAEFRRSMQSSRVALCPESIPGVLPYRFFEAMSAGRVPLLVSSDYVLPFAIEIPYDDFIIRCERADADRAGSIAVEFLRTHSDDEIARRGRWARNYWERYLNRDHWPRTMTYAVVKQLHKMGLLAAA